MIHRCEIQFDGLVGPTHNYAGLSPATSRAPPTRARRRIRAPPPTRGSRRCASCAARGAQAVLPPHDRPSLAALRRLGFHGSDEEVLASRAAAGRRLRASPLLERVGHVDRQRRDGRAVRRRRRRPRAPDPREPAADVPPRDRARDDARACSAPIFADPGAVRRPRPAPRRRAVCRRGRGESSAPRNVARRGPRLRVGARGLGRVRGPEVAPRPPDAGGLGGAGAVAPARPGPLPLPAAAPGRHRRRRVPHRCPRGRQRALPDAPRARVHGRRGRRRCAAPRARRRALRRACIERRAAGRPRRGSVPVQLAGAHAPRRLDGHRRAVRRARGRPRPRAARTLRRGERAPFAPCITSTCASRCTTAAARRACGCAFR